MIELPFQPFFWVLAAAAAFQAARAGGGNLDLPQPDRPLGFRAAWAAAETDTA